MPPKQGSGRKRRGRKPRGGKLTPSTPAVPKERHYQQAVLLHLKCVSDEIESPTASGLLPHPISQCGTLDFSPVVDKTDVDKGPPVKLESKLSNIAADLRNNSMSIKRSACFWCTCAFSTVPVYIPKVRTQHEVEVYGHFCSPECAAAYLFDESNLDESTKFERYHMLCCIYTDPGKKEQIKPAPSPYYLLDRYMGDLSAEQFREIHNLKSNVLVVEKPLTGVLPELHIERAPRPRTSGYVLERQNTTKSKSASLSRTFGISPT